MGDSPLSRIRFVSRETIHNLAASATLAMYECPLGFLVIWICSCGVMREQVVEVAEAAEAIHLATANYRTHCEKTRH